VLGGSRSDAIFSELTGSSRKRSNEFMEGRDTWGWILFDHPYEGIIAERTMWNIMTQISGGLTFVHSRSIIHRDLKPQNGEARCPGATLISSIVLKPGS
jgi:serine/threonine protein kinase